MARPDNHIVKVINSISLKVSDLKTLNPACWLNDQVQSRHSMGCVLCNIHSLLELNFNSFLPLAGQVINVYMFLLRQRSSMSVYAFDSFFYSDLKNMGYEQLMLRKRHLVILLLLWIIVDLM